MKASSEKMPLSQKASGNKVIPLPSIKAFPSRKAWEEACWKKVVSQKETLPDYIITPYERRIIVLRIAAVHRLAEGKSYKDIGRELWLSPQTISAIKKGLRDDGYRSYNARSKTEGKKSSYSADPNPRRPRHIRLGAPHRTKYGTLYF